MSVPLFDLLTREWLVAIFLIAAISFLTLRFRRGSFFSPSRTSLYWGAIFILLAVGSLLSTLFKPTQLEKLPWVLGSLGLGLMLSCLLLWFAGRWSFWNGLAIGGLLCLTLGAWAVPSLQASGASFVGSIPSLELVEPIYLILLLFVPLIIVLSLHSLAGLGPIRRWVALGLRCFLIIALVLALAEPRLKRPSENVAVCFVIDRSLSVPQEIDQTTSDSPGGPVDFRWRRIQTFINDAVTRRGNAHRNDQTGVIFFARRPQLVMPASAVDRMYVSDSLASTMDPNYTDIAASIKLAMASFPEGVGKRIVLISDGNENLGNAEQQAYLAKQNGIQIDTLPLAVGYRNENEVLVQAVEAPPQIATGARLPIRVLIRNAHPTRIVRGRLELLQSRDGNEKPVPIQASQDVLDASRSPALVRLRPGLNVFSFRDRAETAKKEEEFSFTYRAVFQPLEAADPDGGNRVEGLPGDRIQNNRALTQVIARGQRRVLFIEQDTADGSHQFLIEQMRAAKFKVFPVNAARLPQNRNDLSVFLSNYDCLVICDVPAEMLREQQEGIRSNTYDQGCGLVMIGGPDSFGAGGYHKTAIELALPVDCDIKAMKAAGKGGLVLIMHASEMADGNKWQKDIAKLAIERLNAIDMVGVMQYGGINPIWHIPFQTVGDDRGKLLGAIDRMTPGDMPDFDPFLKSAYDTLSNPKHGLAVRHTILISDGDPPYGPIGQAATAAMAKDGITCTTVGVATHGVSEDQKMQKIANDAAKGSKFYSVSDPRKLPAIYMKESRRVSQSYIYNQRFNPKLILRGGVTEKLEAPLPDLFGFVRTTLKPSPLAEMLIEGPRTFDQKFPILAAWQYGLGRSVAFTSDAKSIPMKTEGWDRQWAGSEIYVKFWEQTIGWAMRGLETDRLVVRSEYRDGRIRVTVEALDEQNRPIPDLILQGGITNPASGDQTAPIALKFDQRGSGLYEAEFKGEETGTYLVNVVAKQMVPIFPDGQPRYKGRKEEGLPMKVFPMANDANQGTLADGTVVRKLANGNWVYDDDGKPIEVQDKKEKLLDSRRTGVTLSYSPEFSDLESNSGLMRRLSEITNGKVYSEDPAELQALAKSGDLYRPVPSSLRSLQPLWFWLVFAAGVLLFFDVAIRRISLEPEEVQAALNRLWGRVRQRSSVSTSQEDAFLGRLRQRKESASEALERERATRRFDSSTAPTSQAPSGANVVEAKPILPAPPPKPMPKEEAKPEGGDDYFSKLRRAKKRSPHEKPPDSQEDNERPT